MRPVFASLALFALGCLAAAPPAFAQSASDKQTPAQDKSAQGAPATKTFIALAMADGPTADDRLVLSFRGTSANEVTVKAVRACYERAAQGFIHTCQISYGSAWVVGTVCPQSPTLIKFAIGDSRDSPEAAQDKAVTFLRDVEHADVSACHIVAEYNADDMQVARSVAKDRK